MTGTNIKNAWVMATIKRSILRMWWKPLSFFAIIILLLAASARKRSIMRHSEYTVDEIVSRVRDGLRIDAIMVLGGGRPLSDRRTMPFVEERCAAAVAVYEASILPKPKVLTLSAGTAHSPQLMTTEGLPIWESTAAAGSLLDRGLPASALLVETTSFDTIGNAFFARTSHADLAGWRTVAIITSDFHMPRTRAIFEWIFPHINLVFISTPAVGLSAEAVDARKQREKRSLDSITLLRTQYPKLHDVRNFITTQHELYTAQKLVQRASSMTKLDPKLLASYGGGIDHHP
mmetsp:Transcript_8953/g.13762  ORF Transcript_8953/g.13762 Transcript_8953/m.13762 type:complete len:289 (+) Transcript_8953:40-906(+)